MKCSVCINCSVSSLTFSVLPKELYFSARSKKPLSEKIIKVLTILILSSTIVVVWSAVSGIGKGIKLISDANLYIAVAFMIIAFVVGPKVPILNDLVNSFGQYLQNFVQDSLMVRPFGDNS